MFKSLEKRDNNTEARIVMQTQNRKKRSARDIAYRREPNKVVTYYNEPGDMIPWHFNTSNIVNNYLYSQINSDVHTNVTRSCDIKQSNCTVQNLPKYLAVQRKNNH